MNTRISFVNKNDKNLPFGNKNLVFDVFVITYVGVVNALFLKSSLSRRSAGSIVLY